MFAVVAAAPPHKQGRMEESFLEVHVLEKGREERVEGNEETAERRRKKKRGESDQTARQKGGGGGGGGEKAADDADFPTNVDKKT